MSKLTINNIQEIWWKLENETEESIFDLFISTKIKDIDLIFRYWQSNFPDLYKYVMSESGNSIPWKYIDDQPIKCNDSLELYSDLPEMVNKFYNLWNDDWTYSEYGIIMSPWSSLIHDIDEYYELFIEFMEDIIIEGEYSESIYLYKSYYKD